MKKRVEVTSKESYRIERIGDQDVLIAVIPLQSTQVNGKLALMPTSNGKNFHLVKAGFRNTELVFEDRPVKVNVTALVPVTKPEPKEDKEDKEKPSFQTL